MEKNLHITEIANESQAKEPWVKPTVETLSVLEDTLAAGGTGTDGGQTT